MRHGGRGRFKFPRQRELRREERLSSNNEVEC